LCNQGGFSYVPQCAAIKTMGTDGLKGIKRTSTFCDQGRNVVMECEGVTDTYTKYVYFIKRFDTRSGGGIGK